MCACLAQILVFQYIDDLSKAYLVSRWQILRELLLKQAASDLVPFRLLLRKWARVDYGKYVREGLEFGPVYIEQISSALAGNTTLSELRFRRGQMSFVNVLHLCQALQANTSLRSFVRLRPALPAHAQTSPLRRACL